MSTKGDMQWHPGGKKPLQQRQPAWQGWLLGHFTCSCAVHFLRRREPCTYKDCTRLSRSLPTVMACLTSTLRTKKTCTSPRAIHTHRSVSGRWSSTVALALVVSVKFLARLPWKQIASAAAWACIAQLLPK